LDDYLYPHENSFENKAEFKVFWSSSETIIKKRISEDDLINIDDLKIKIEPISTNPEKKIFGDKSLPLNDQKGNLKVFQTELVYDSIHKDSVLEIISQFRVHSKKDIESLKNSYDFILSDSDVYRFFFKNYLNESDFNKRPLARMTRDITEQLSDIYNVDLFK